MTLPGLLLAACAGSPSTLDPRGPFAARTATLTWLMFAIATIVFVIVVALLLFAFLRRRRDTPGNDVHINPTQDRRALAYSLIGGALAPALILFAIMGYAITIDRANAAANGEGAIEVIGHEWWWEVRYPAQGFTTANEIHIPVGRPVTLRLTSGDVIHSFWVPQLHGKLDMLPGQTNIIDLQADEPGIYRGVCAEFCGLQHAHMDFIVVAQPQQEYLAWLQQQKQPAPAPANALIMQGQQAFLGSSCVYCHAVNGTNASSRLGPDLTHLASRSTIGAGALANTPGNLSGWIINSQTTKPGNKMPPMDLDPDQLPALLAYLESLR